MIQGQQYSTTYVRASINSTTPPEWLPVIGPSHDDAKYIGFTPIHLHIDWRFLDDQQREKVLAFGDTAPNDIVISYVYPEDRLEPISLGAALADGVPPAESFLKEMTQTYRSPFPAYPKEPPYWLPALSKAYRNARLGENRICPHQGTDLSGMEPDEQGIITCPLHGLLWIAKTGAAAPTATTPAANVNNSPTGRNVPSATSGG